MLKEGDICKFRSKADTEIVTTLRRKVERFPVIGGGERVETSMDFVMADGWTILNIPLCTQWPSGYKH